MKFYYNGKLVRTSKNHVYTHAVINENGGCIACSSTRKGAEQVISSEISYNERRLQTQLNKKKAIEEGAAGYWDVSERKHYWEKFRGKDYQTLEYAEEQIEWYKKQIEVVRSWKVVELEAK